MDDPLPDLSPVEHVWDQLKRQMPPFHSVHDLELAVQDLWTHLPQDNIRVQLRIVLRAACCRPLGYFIGPVVLTNLPDDSRCMQEEIFGPVTCLTPFEDIKDVIQRANKVNYGLSATIWSTDLQKIHSIAPKLEVGTVWCNCWLVRNLHMPFGGEKRSGLGREGTEDSREFYTHKKTICIKYKLKNDSFF
ncbi:2-aminomuconic semialdehyde dehydrogenase [Trichonephila clavipes]|nr:2-aminomuconic semialdehyde dehydrogenase [Trichonephila clavipes]